jgi:hypothetical protein
MDYNYVIIIAHIIPIFFRLNFAYFNNYYIFFYKGQLHQA